MAAPAEIGEEVLIPPQVRFGVVPPLLMMGQVPVTAVTEVEVLMKARPPVVLFQPSTCPPMPLPKSEEVARAVGVPVVAPTYPRMLPLAMEARLRVTLEPPIWEPREPLVTVRLEPTASEEV